MSPVSCPKCDARLSEPEQLDGWCESCGKALPPHISAAAAKHRRHGHRDDANPAAPAPAASSRWRWWSTAGQGSK